MDFLLIGFDGCDFDLFMEQLPSLPFLSKQVIAKGRMRSQDKLTGISWTNIGTGVGKEKHGVTDPWGRPLGTSNSFATVEYPYIWEMLNSHGKVCGVYSFPCTYPPRMCNRWMVSGFPTPMIRQRCTLDGKGKVVNCIAYPPDIQVKYLEKYIPDIVQLVTEEKGMPAPRGGAFLTCWNSVLTFEAVMRRIDKLNRDNLDCLHALMAEQPVDFLFTQWGFIDRIGHLIGLTTETIPTLFLAMDKIVEELVTRYKPKNWMMVSDHGFQKFDHTENAIMIIHSPNVLPDEFKSTEWDVPPTILYMFDLPPPTATPLQGRPPYGVFLKNQMSSGDMDAITQRLRDLGYMA